MKKYKYLGTSILSFTHNGNDYIVYGEGPHELPSDAEIVKVNIAKELLVEADKKK